jgi:hypothetical protein
MIPRQTFSSGVREIFGSCCPQARSQERVVNPEA